MAHSIVTIGRQYGSGGHEIGKLLAELLGAKFYDKDLLTLAAKEGGFNEKITEEVDEKPASSLLYSMVTSLGNLDGSMNCLPLNDRLFIAQAKVIKRAAGEGPCVIVGRCADYILRDVPDCINVFIHAPMDYRIRRICRLYDMSEADAQAKIVKTDKQRANYSNHYSDRKWGRVDNFHLSFDSSALSAQRAAELIKTYVEMKRDCER